MCRSTSARPGGAPSSSKPKNKYDWQRWTATVKLPSDGYYEIWTRGDGFQGRDAAAHRRRLESAGLRRQSDAPHRGAGRLMRDGRRSSTAAGLALAVAVAALGWRRRCAAQQFTPRDEKPGGLSRRRRPRRHVLCLHRLPRLQAGRAAGHDPPAVGGIDRHWMIERHSMPPLPDEGAEGRARLSRGDVSAARAGAGRGGWQNPFRAALTGVRGRAIRPSRSSDGLIWRENVIYGGNRAER